jgi:ankyrin repeat protein
MDSLNRSRIMDLVSATQRGDVAWMNQLLALDVRPEEIDLSSGLSALHAAVLFKPENLPTLLAHCRNPDYPRVMGGTPLSYIVHELGDQPNAARRNALLKAMNQLLRVGASPHAGGSDQTPLELARLYGLRDVEALLIEGASDSDA